jgi:hypothetical protein
MPHRIPHAVRSWLSLAKKWAEQQPYRDVQISSDVLIGNVQVPVNVCADVIEVVGPVLVHGSLQARTRGVIAMAPTFGKSRSIHPELKDKA